MEIDACNRCAPASPGLVTKSLCMLCSAVLCLLLCVGPAAVLLLSSPLHRVVMTYR